MAFPQLWVVPFYIVLILMTNKYPKVCGLLLLTLLVWKNSTWNLVCTLRFGICLFLDALEETRCCRKSLLRSSGLAVTTSSNTQNLKMMAIVKGSRTSCSLCFGNRFPYSLFQRCFLLFVCAFALANSSGWVPGPFCCPCWWYRHRAVDACRLWEDERAGGAQISESRFLDSEIAIDVPSRLLFLGRAMWSQCQ